MFVLSDLPRPIVRYGVGIWHRRKMILVLAWILAISGWLWMSMVPDSYESRSEIYLNTDQSLRPNESLAARPDFDERVRVMRLALLTRENLEEVIIDTGLDAKIFNEIQRERMVEGLAGSINVESPEDQYFIISYRDQNPVMAQRVVQSVVELFKEKDLGNALNEYDKSIETYTEQIAKYEAQLKAKEQEIAEFRRLHAAELASTSRLPGRLEQKEGILSSAIASIAAAERRRVSLQSTLAKTPRNAPGSEVDQLKITLAELQSQFNDNYPDIQAIKARIAELESGSTALPSNPEYKRLEANLDAVEEELINLNALVRRTEKEIDDLAKTMAQVPTLQAELTDITRNYDDLQKRYIGYRNQLGLVETSAEIGSGAGGIRYLIKESPKVAAEPIAPPRGLITMIITIAALGSAVGVAFLLTQVDRTYTQSADLEDALGLPVLGSISPSLTKKYRRGRLLERLALVGAVALMFATASYLYYLQEIYVEEGEGESLIVTSGLNDLDDLRSNVSTETSQ